ncbi:MAG: hypothetical protein OHK0012_16770 [Synechococcales cyanobacterium]
MNIAAVGLAMTMLVSASLPTWAEELEAPDTVELNVGTSTTLVLPPVPTVRVIGENDSAESTTDQPLSLMGEVLLDAVCSDWIPAEVALKIFPDLSPTHIRNSCPQAMRS